MESNINKYQSIDMFRSNYTWTIKETEKSIFHLDSYCATDKDIPKIIDGTLNRYQAIADILCFDLHSTKANEKRLKHNYWFFGPQLITDIGMAGNADLKGFGSVSASGIDYVVNNDRWSNHTDKIHHEEVHLLVKYELGEAPPLFNEGIATYVEYLIYKNKDEFRKLYSDAWKNHMTANAGRLQKLMATDYFWSNFGKLPLYTIGAACVYYIVERYGVNLLKDIFEKTHYQDDAFGSVVESKTRLSIDSLETEITKFFLE